MLTEMVQYEDKLDKWTYSAMRVANKQYCTNNKGTNCGLYCNCDAHL